MKRVPTKLKQLAERRARIAGEFDACKKNNGELQAEVAELTRRLRIAESCVEPAIKNLARLTKAMATIDASIVMLNNDVNPGAIQPIYAWKGKYGKRGSLRKYICFELENRYPSYFQTSELAELAIAEFSLTFTSQKERSRFQNKSIGEILRLFTNMGVLERGEDVIFRSQSCGTWRWKKHVPQTLKELAASKVRRDGNE